MRSGLIAIAAVFSITYMADAAFAQGGPPSGGGGGGGKTTLSDLGCGPGELARVNAADEWECSADLTANEADTAAAQSTADAAAGDAATAQATADAAQTDAAAAQATADAALSDAATAQSTADIARNEASSAQSTADAAGNDAAVANSTAIAAGDAAAAAQSTAASASSDAAAAQSAADAAQASVDALAAETTLADLNCAIDEIARWDGSQWVCDGDINAAECGPGEVLTGDDECVSLAGLICDVVGPVGACDTERLVFVTSLNVNGDMVSTADALTGTLPASGLDAGDLICQTLAEDAGHAGTFRAWLADASGSPDTRFNKATVPYVRTDGVQIANDYADIVDCTNPSCIEVPIDRDEFGGVVAGIDQIWTNVAPDGTESVAGNDCMSWSSGNQNDFGTIGAVGSGGLNSLWTAGGSGRCDNPNFRHIYCFQQ